jgi:hypothetical protein
MVVDCRSLSLATAKALGFPISLLGCCAFTLLENPIPKSGVHRYVFPFGHFFEGATVILPDASEAELWLLGRGTGRVVSDFLSLFRLASIQKLVNRLGGVGNVCRVIVVK